MHVRLNRVRNKAYLSGPGPTFVDSLFCQDSVTFQLSQGARERVEHVVLDGRAQTLLVDVCLQAWRGDASVLKAVEHVDCVLLHCLFLALLARQRIKGCIRVVERRIDSLQLGSQNIPGACVLPGYCPIVLFCARLQHKGYVLCNVDVVPSDCNRIFFHILTESFE